MAADQDTLLHLRQFYFHVLAPEHFERWLYGKEDLESELSPDAYFTLINSDYFNNSDKERVRQAIANIYPGNVERLQADYSKDIARAALSGGIALDTACRALSDLELSGANNIPAVFDFIVDALDRGNSVETLRQEIVDALVSLVRSE